MAHRRCQGKEEQRARDLFFGLWVPDLFMKRVEAGGPWSLFCPNEARGLVDVWGRDFTELYEKYEATPGLARKVVQARELFNKVLRTASSSPPPHTWCVDHRLPDRNRWALHDVRCARGYHFTHRLHPRYKDACNGKSNQAHLGTIRGSNLCTEIVEFTAPDEVAVCNLASIALQRFYRPDAGGYIDHKLLRDVAYHGALSLNKIIDGNHYPLPEARRSNLRHRPIGLGVQGLADLFCLMRLPFTSAEAKRANREIFETIYFGALEASCDLAKEHGPYESYVGSHASQGRLQPDLWGASTGHRWDWPTLRKRIAEVLRTAYPHPYPSLSLL